jgi:D-lactate dehydrogenase
MAEHFRLVETGGRAALAMGHLVQSVFGFAVMQGITRLLNRASRRVLNEPFWQWSAEMPRARRGHVPVRPQREAEAVYFPACISRIMGALPGEQREISVMQALLSVADRAGVKMYVPEDVAGNCCGVPFSSKGFDAAHAVAANRTVENFYRWSDEGRLPIVVDTSPCTYGLKTARPHLTVENQARFDSLTILDSVEFANDYLLQRLPIYRKVDSVALHPVCSAVKMAITPKLVNLARACSRDVAVPADAGCCAFAGDRGFLFPELTASATKVEANEVRQKQHDGYYSSSRTCEIGMTRATGKIYQSYVHLLEYASRSDAATKLP